MTTSQKPTYADGGRRHADDCRCSICILQPKHAAPEGEELIAEVQRWADEYDSLMARWREARGGSQEIADLHATFKARERDLGKLAESGFFRKIAAALTQGKQQADPKVCSECRHPIGSDACVHWVRLPQPLTSEERDVVRGAIRDSAELVATGRMAVDRSQPVGAGLTALPAKWDEEGSKFEALGDPISVAEGAVFRNLAKELRSALSVAASAPAGWISVDEQLPAIGTVVLLWAWAENHGEDDDGNWFAKDVSEVGMGVCKDGPCGPYIDNFATPFADREAVTHWMPLPASPSLPVSVDGKEGQQ